MRCVIASPASDTAASSTQRRRASLGTRSMSRKLVPSSSSPTGASKDRAERDAAIAVATMFSASFDSRAIASTLAFGSPSRSIA